MTGEPLRHSVIIVVVPCETTANCHLVTIVLLLETVITGFIFSDFWTASARFNVDFDFLPTVVSSPIIFAPIAGLGERQIDLDYFIAD